jgi:mitochondrial FAD-linked sulfhydryl oxidase
MATRAGSGSSTKSMAGIMAMVGASTASTNQEPKSSPKAYKACPPDVEVLGRSTWTFLHTMAGQYPIKASENEQIEMKTFLNVFSKVYPCWWCADDLQKWMQSEGNEPKVGGREELGNWLCDAHNEVNKKLKKPIFDCREWKARWRDGWSDGSCD